MKNLFDNYKKIVAGLTASLLLLGNTTSYSVNAYSDKTNEKCKFSSELIYHMDKNDKMSRIPVWIWFNDINQNELLQEFESETGLTLNDIEFDFFSNNAFRVDSDEKTKFEYVTKYLSETTSERSAEKDLTRKYLKSKRSNMAEAYKEYNGNIIKKLNIKEKDIAFQSSLTSSVLANLSVDEIKKIAESEFVESIDYYDDDEAGNNPPVNTRTNERETMRVDEVQEITGLSGDGINVIVFDHGWVRPEVDYFNDIDISKVHTVYHHQIYDPTNSSNLYTPNEISSHPNLIASTLQQFASDVNIYSVGYGEYDDVEWTILNCDIDIINGSINLGTSDTYNNDAAAKWMDAIISTYSIPFVASAGNSETWQPHGWPNVISPASGYNSIAVGAYSFYSNPNRMHNFRYNPIDSTEQVNYKPDIVVASPSTSESSPMVTGIIAMMIQLKPSLAANPELIKAILMASCQRKVESTYNAPIEVMYDGLTQRQGAGAIDAYNAISIVLHGTYGINNISTGSLDVKNLNTSFENTNVNVSMTWLKKNTNTMHGYTNVGNAEELELEILDGDNIICSSDCKNTCKQMAYFSISDEDDYLIRVKKVSNDNENTRFAYAWSTDNEYLEDNTYSIEYHVTGDWETGQNITIEITNNGNEPIRGWALKCNNFEGEIDRNSMWNCELVGDNILINKLYNSDIAVGETVRFGYNLNNPTRNDPEFTLCTFRNKMNEGYNVSINCNTPYWENHFIGYITITNTTDEPIMAWELTFTADNFENITSNQFMIVGSDRNTYTITGTYNGNIPIPANTSITMQFNADKTTYSEPTISNISLTEMVY